MFRRLWFRTNLEVRDYRSTILYSKISKVLNQNGSGFSVDLIRSVKRRLIRVRRYFNSLKKTERSILDLCIICRPKFKSRLLLKVLTSILNKVVDYLKSFRERFVERGRPIAERMSELASSWGNQEARLWKHDVNYMFYLGFHNRGWSLQR